ncbi:MAG: DMT family transporter, partial [Chlamydiia bacterium]|nr:DMT family transporter [Chlamydiia bacterium]
RGIMIQHLKRPQKRLILGMVLMVIASLVLAVQAACVKLASKELSTNFIVFARSLVNLIVLLVWVALSPTAPKFSELFKGKNYRYFAVRVIFGLAAVYCFYISINHFSLATGTLIFYSFPLFVPIISRIWLGVKLIRRLWWGLGIAFIGLLFVLRPGENLFNPLSFVPLVGAIFIATAFLAVRALRYTEPWERITAYFFTFSVIVSAVVLYLSPDRVEEYSFYSLGLAGLAGFFAAIFQGLLTVAAKFAPMRFLSPFVYLSFIFGAVIQYFLWGESVAHGVILGFCLIVVGTILLVFLYPKEDLQFAQKKKVAHKKTASKKK